MQKYDLSVAMVVLQQDIEAHFFCRQLDLGNVTSAYVEVERWLQKLIPVANLVLKRWGANVFFRAGLTKIESFDTTLMLFNDEYSVPLLSPVVAAYMGTAAELILPVMLVMGLMARFSAAGLFVVNIVAAISYPEISEAGIRDHIVWGIMLFVAMVHGSGPLVTGLLYSEGIVQECTGIKKGRSSGLFVLHRPGINYIPWDAAGQRSCWRT